MLQGKLCRKLMVNLSKDLMHFNNREERVVLAAPVMLASYQII